MDIVLFAAAAFASIFHTSVGSISVKCNDVDPFSTSNVKCSCYNPGGLGITWYRDDTSLTDCFLSSEICFSSVGYTFAVNSTTFTYTIEFGSYSYTDCSSVSCNDSTNPSDSELRKISIDETSLSPTIQLLSEPISNKSNGIISFKTDCLYKANSTWINVTAKWTAVIGNAEYDLQLDETISENASCQSCSDDFAATYLIEYEHKEGQSGGNKQAQLRLRLFLNGIHISSLTSTTHNFYNFKVRSDPRPGSKCNLICIIFIIVGVVVLVYYCIVVITWCIRKEDMNSSKASKCCAIVPIYGIIYICGRKSGKGVKPVQCEENLQQIHITKSIPDSPTMLQVKDVTISSFTVSWKPGNDGRCKQTFYVHVDKVEHKVDGDVCEYVCTNLIQGKYYNISVKAKNDKGDSTRTQPIRVRTLGIPDPPTKLQVKQIKTSSIKVSWEPGNDGGYKQTFYVLVDNEEHEVNGDVCDYVCTNLKQRTHYNISMKAKNVKGESPRTQPIPVTTLGIPDPPTELVVNDMTTESIKVSWKPGYDGGYKQTFYVHVDKDKHTVNGDECEYVCTKLKPGTYYNISVNARNEKGESARTQQISVRTLGPPEPSSSVKLVNKSQTSITLEWIPGSDGGFEQCFIVMDNISKKQLTEEIEDTQALHGMRYTIENLEKGQMYHLQVISKNEKGNSKSSVVEVKT